MKKQKVLITLFVGSLVLPNLIWAGFSGYFNTENNENRELASFPQVSLASLGDFPSQFEAFYKDHVPFKNALVNFNNFIDTEFFQTTKIGDVVIGEDNWLFYLPSKDGENAMADYQKTNVYSLEQSAEIAAKIEKVRDWFLDNGVGQFHYYVAPSKETIYSEYMPDKPEVIGVGDSRMETFARYMKENSDVEFDFLADYLEKYSEKYQLFRKYDTHMNNLGGYITNEKIVEDLTGECLPIGAIQVMMGTNPCRGDLSRMIGRYKELDDDREYGLDHFHDGVRYKVKKEKNEGGEEILKVFKSNSSNEKTLMVIGDSFRLRLEKYMPYRYQKTVFVRIDDFNQELLEKYMPDDVILITVERDQRYMENLDSYIIQAEEG
ncbi:alginate O-acetyltransferase AlgX-related protein [Blautia sp.]